MIRGNIDLGWWIAYHQQQIESICDTTRHKMELNISRTETDEQKTNEEIYKHIEAIKTFQRILASQEGEEEEDFL